MLKMKRLTNIYGGLLDISARKDMELFHQEHSICGKEALVIRNGETLLRLLNPS